MVELGAVEDKVTVFDDGQKPLAQFTVWFAAELCPLTSEILLQLLTLWGKW